MDSKDSQKDLTYLKRFASHKSKVRPMSMGDFRTICTLALQVKRAFPEDRQYIAYELVGASANKGNRVEGSIVRQIADLASFLEIPDPHVFTGDGLSVAQKWEKLEALVEQLPAE